VPEYNFETTDKMGLFMKKRIFYIYVCGFGGFELRFVYGIVLYQEQITSTDTRSDVTFVKNCRQRQNVSFEDGQRVLLNV